MRLVFRTSLPFAWTLLGDKAPLMADEAGRAVVVPLLENAAPSLFAVSQDGELMIPLKVEAMFEPDDHFAFVLNFQRPVKWPVLVKASPAAIADQLDATTIAVFDLTASPFARDIEPILKQEMRRERPSISFDLTGKTSAPASVAGETVPVLEPSRRRSLGWLVSSAIATVLVLGVWKWISRKR